MRFVVVRGSNSLCNPDCPEWISAQGAITSRTPQELRQLLATLGGRRLPIVISSPGGDLFGAIISGRLIRDGKLDVAVAETEFIECDPGAWNCVAKDGAYVGLSNDSGGHCDSACALMLAGGVRRIVGSQPKVSFSNMGHKQVVKAYLDEMQIDPALLAAAEKWSVERRLQPAMMLRVGLMTGPQSVDALTGATLCKEAPKPGNCRAQPSANAQSGDAANL
jgi:hypothetical protein